MGAVESKVPDEFTTLPAKVQETYRSLFKRLVAAGTTPDLALLELIAIYCAVEDPQAFIAGVDLDGDGSVSTAEIEKVMIMAGASKKDAHKAAKAVVHAADVDHDGDLNVHELGVFATPAEVRKAIAAGALVLDVREVVEGAENPDVVPGSLSLPYLHEDEGLSFETAFKQLPILVYSSNGKDAGGAVARLKDLGFSNAANGFNGNHINNALKDGPTAKEMADLEAAEADLLAAKDAYSRAARIAAKAGTTIQVAKLNAKAVGQQAAAAAETTMIAKSDYERAGRVAAKAAATQQEAKAHAKVAGKEAAGAAATILAAKEDHDRTAKIAAKAAATRTHAKEAASHAAVEAAATAVIKGVAPVAAE